jgi:fibronectin type 3 domain-containing protein
VITGGAGGLGTPTNVVATAASATSVAVSWNAASGAAKYHVYRTTTNLSTFQQVNGESTTVSPFTDSTAAAATAYLYKVRAVDNTNVESGDSNKDLATTVIFANDPLVTGPSGTTVQAVHVTQLRTAVTAVCALAANPPPCSTAFTDPTLTAQVTTIKRLHVTELRAKLDAALSTLGLTALAYTDPTITATVTTVKAAHITDLRNGVK